MFSISKLFAIFRRTGSFMLLVALTILLVALTIPLATFMPSARAEAQPDEPIYLASPLSAIEKFAAGDRIRIIFLELLDLPASSGSGETGAQPATRSFYQRLDLTGEYVVQPDGMVSLPRLGSFNAANRSTKELQSSLAEAFEQIIGGACEVTITIKERQPVYVIGAAQNPGAYKYVSGMMVLHAFALAGGLEKSLERKALMVDILREKKRHAGAALALTRLIAQRARIEAERDGREHAQTPQRLIKLGGEQEAGLLMQSENALLAQLKASHDEKIRQAHDRIAAIRREVAAIEQRRSKGVELISLRKKRVEELVRLSRNGAVRTPIITLAKTDLAEIEARAHLMKVNFLRAEQRLEEAERSATLLKRERQTRIARELAKNTEKMIGHEKEVASIEGIFDAIVLSNLGTERDPDRSIVVFEVVRSQGHGKAQSVKADEMTPLFPGDIVRVKSSISRATISKYWRGNLAGSNSTRE